eukprot:SAG31_NODE_12501_length_936_cov_5.367981_1_plen_193_part_00
MRRMLQGIVIEEDKEWWKTSNIKSINDISQLQDAVTQNKNKLIQDIPEMEKKGSGWTFHKVLTVELHIGRYKAIKGGSYIQLPKVLSTKKAIINVKNKDHECFKWSLLASQFPAKRDGERISKYVEHQEKLDFTGISYPTSWHPSPPAITSAVADLLRLPFTAKWMIGLKSYTCLVPGIITALLLGLQHIDA